MAISNERLKELLKETLPYVEQHDLVGTGGLPAQHEIESINDLMTEIIEVLELDPDDFGFHGRAG